MSLWWKPILWGLGLVLGLGAAAYAYYAHAPIPPEPRLSARLRSGIIEVGGRRRTYQLYVPAKLPPNAPLLLVLHGSNLDGLKMRQWTGFRFDELADQHGFVVAYPDGYRHNWNDCRRDAPYPAKRANIDDVGFLQALAARCQADFGTDGQRVYAFGFSNGGQMAFRLGMETQLLAGLTAIGASLPTPETCSCPPDAPTPPVLLASGTQDPISPYAGGRVSMFGVGYHGMSISVQASAEQLARRNGLTAPPETRKLPHRAPADPTSVTEQLWRRDGKPYVVLYTLHGVGHVVPQPGFRFPRIMGRSTPDLDVVEQAVRFFGLMP